MTALLLSDSLRGIWLLSKSCLYFLILRFSVVLQRDLMESFKEVSVGVEDCPDLTKAPFHLAAEGLSGSPRICDVGGVYLNGLR